MYNLTVFRRTVETGVDPRLGHCFFTLIPFSRI